MTSRCYDEELAWGLARSFSLRTLRKGVGCKAGSSGNGEGRKRRGNAEGRRNWQSQWDGGAGLPAFSKSMYLTARGKLVKFSDLQLVFCSLHRLWTVPKGQREGPTWEWASIRYQDTRMSIGKTWGSLDFIPISTVSSSLEKNPAFF